MPISDWPICDRPREKLLARGAQALTDAELVAIFLRTGTKHRSALQLARDLIDTFGGIKNLLEAPLLTLMTHHGIGKTKYATLKAAIELGKRFYMQPGENGDSFTSSSKSRRFILDQLRHHTSEVFACLFLDSQYRLIRYEQLFYGTLNEAPVYPREIVRRALLYHASAIILAHNHPSGNVNPSEADQLVTESINNALKLLDIKLLDHVIAGGDSTFSFKENGYLR